MQKNTALSLLALLGVVSLPLAAQDTAELDEIQVTAKENAKSSGEIQKSRRAIQDELINADRRQSLGISRHGVLR